MHGKLQLEYEESLEGDPLDNSIGLQFEWNGGDQRCGERDEVAAVASSLPAKREGRRLKTGGPFLFGRS